MERIGAHADVRHAGRSHGSEGRGGYRGTMHSGRVEAGRDGTKRLGCGWRVLPVVVRLGFLSGLRLLLAGVGSVLVVRGQAGRSGMAHGGPISAVWG